MSALSEGHRALAARVAADVDQEMGGLRDANRAYDAHLTTDGGPPAAAVQLDDVSAIPFLDGILGVERYQLRARVRAATGDLVLTTFDGPAGYEAYNRAYLGLGSPEALVVAPAPGRGAVFLSEAAGNGPGLDQLAAFATRAGGVCLHPYMGSEPVWELAASLGARVDVPVRVLAPPPPITWLANDKASLSRVANAVVEEALGTPAVVDTVEAKTSEALARALAELASRHRRVALKKTRCASAMGNRVFLSADVVAMTPAGLQTAVEAFLADKESVPGETVLACAWEDTESSPSSQLWIPPIGHGPPRLDGLYDQLLEGEESVFLGSVPFAGPPEVGEWMTQASLLVATVFQQLGYVGRCSFDFIVAGGVTSFVECNGRWGGTSTPMALMDRLFPGGRPAYRARDVVEPALVGATFDDVIGRLGDLLYDARTGRGNLVAYNVGPLGPHGKLDLIGFGRDPAEAEYWLEERAPAALRRG